MDTLGVTDDGKISDNGQNEGISDIESFFDKFAGACTKSFMAYGCKLKWAIFNNPFHRG